MSHPLLQEYVAVVAKIDVAVQTIVERRSDAVTCHSGCDGCCVGGLTVLSVEAFAIQEFLDVHEDNLPNRRGNDACVFLSAGGTCTIYPVRPLLCRSHGLPIRMARDEPSTDETSPMDGPGVALRKRGTLQVLQDVEVCHLNFQNDAPMPEDVLDAERISALLLVVEQRFRERAGLPAALERIALADLCP